MTKYVIVGAGESGTRAALDLKEAGDVTLITDERHWPYERPPLSKPNDTKVVMKPIATQEALAHVSFRSGVSVQGIDRPSKRILLDDGQYVIYDKLLLATGASPRALTCPGGEHALVLRGFDDAQEIYARAATARSAVVIGAGLIGLELAAVLRSQGLDVTVLEAGPRALGRALSSVLAEFLVKRHEVEGVNFQFDTKISHLASDTVHLASGEALGADLIVAAIGVTPNVTIAEDARLACNNGITVDRALKTSDPDIFAAGDCANLTDPESGAVRFEAWRAAVEMGAAAAASMSGKETQFAPMPWFWSDQYDVGLQMVGRHDPACTCVTRPIAGGVLFFELDEAGLLTAAAGIGPGNSIAKDIKISERMIAASICPAPEALADTEQPMKNFLKRTFA